jgi:torulene dioxygenase
MSVFQGALNINKPTDPTIANVSVTIRPNLPGLESSRKEEGKTGHSTGLKTLWTTSDNAQLKELDPLTLEPIGITSQKVLHPSLKGPFSCAHAQSDHLTGNIYNYNLALGRLATYRIFKTSASTGETEILATISGSGVRPAYLHSFFLTEDFVVLCIWNAHFEGMGLKILTERNLLDAIAPFDASLPARWFVIDRKHGRGLVSEFEGPAAFCFHTINAWQETNSKGEVDIVCNLSEYENLDILHSLYYSNMTSEGANAVTFNKEKGVTSLPRFARYRLGNIGSKTTKVGKEIKKAELVLTLPKRTFGDLPTMNPLYQTRPNRYIYSIVNDGRSTFLNSISKVDFETKEVKFWDNEFGHTPGEAIFVPRPDGEEEDDGCLLSVVLDGKGKKSYLVVLDARTMREVGRANCEWVVGLGFHGTHVKV